MFKDWRNIPNMVDPYTGWLKIHIPNLKRTLYEKQQGAYRLSIVYRDVESKVTVGFSISEEDFSVCDIPATREEVKDLLSRWTSGEKMEDPKLLNETREAAKHD